MRARVVIGANFGDEGKGLMVDYLCATQGAGVVVRFNGGAQAGHTVVTPEGKRHVFRHFGSGTFTGSATYLSQFFVCNPILFFEELSQLTALGITPAVYAHPDCLITTYADMMINQAKEDARGDKRHGSCGVGFHETITRSEHLPHLKITMGDLWNDEPRILDQLEEICGKYAQFRCGKTLKDLPTMEKFLEGCRLFAQYVQPMGIAQLATADPVFEGSQGLLLDQNNKEFFPHVTHSNTGMQNVRELCKQAGIGTSEIYYVSRTYLTRHGAGPLPGEDPKLSYDDNTNRPTKYQGHLRFAPLVEGELLDRCHKDAAGEKFGLVLTHCDQEDPRFVAKLYSVGPTRDNVLLKMPAPAFAA